MLSKDAVILIADDMRMIRSALKNFLSTLGYDNFIEAENGAEAIKKLNSNDVSVLFLDVVMPIMTGLDALKKLREEKNTVPVVMLTSIADQKVIDECKLYGIVDYILKPINVTTAPDLLKKALVKAGQLNTV